MSTCGICLRRPFLIAVPIDDDGKVHPPLGVPRTDEERRWLLGCLKETEGPHCEFVLPEGLVRIDSIGQMALAQGSIVWITPQWLLEAISSASWQSRVPPRRRAAILARLPLISTLRPYLRRFHQTPDQQQLPLL